MSEALWSLRQRVENLLGEALKGTPGGYLTVSTFGCLALGMYEDDYFNDWHGRFYEGTHKDTSFVVTDFTQAGGIIAFLPALSTKTDATDLFELIPPDFSAGEINNAINLAIAIVAQEALQDKLDTSIEVVASTYEYVLPSGFLFLDGIYQEESTAGRYSATAGRVDSRHWDILHGTPPKVWFNHSLVSLTAGRHLRLVGQGSVTSLTLDADTCAISPVFLAYQATAILHQSRIRGSGAEFENHDTQMRLAQAIADRERKNIRVSGRGRQVVY